jgi:hypothetical protein
MTSGHELAPVRGSADVAAGATVPPAGGVTATPPDDPTALVLPDDGTVVVPPDDSTAAVPLLDGAADAYARNALLANARTSAKRAMFVFALYPMRTFYPYANGSHQFVRNLGASFGVRDWDGSARERARYALSNTRIAV